MLYLQSLPGSWFIPRQVNNLSNASIVVMVRTSVLSIAISDPKAEHELTPQCGGIQWQARCNYLVPGNNLILT